MTTVNEVNMAKWIVALRSGKYNQGRGRLRPDDSDFCCLGVACDISGTGSWSEAGWYRCNDWDDSPLVLTESASEWLGINDRNPILEGSGYGAIACGTANDDMHWTFGEIADALERRYLLGKRAEEILAETTDVR